MATEKILVFVVANRTAVGMSVALLRNHTNVYMEKQADGSGTSRKMHGLLKWIEVIIIFFNRNKLQRHIIPTRNIYYILIIITKYFSGVLRLKEQSCSSMGYRIAVSKLECEFIAKRLGLSELSALDSTGDEDDMDKTCVNQTSYRCLYTKSGTLYWNQDCGDNSQDARSNAYNLCIFGNCKINESSAYVVMIVTFEG